MNWRNKTGKSLAKIALGLSAAAMIASPTLAEDDTIKIGMTSALTGPYNEFGEGNRRAVELAIKEWNENGGINGKKIELAMLLDDQLNPDRAVQNMRRILDDEEIVGIIGPAGSGPTLAVIDMAEADGRPYMNPIAQTPDVTYPDGTGNTPRKNVFSFALQNDVEASGMGEHLVNNFDRVGVIHESTAYGVSGLEYLTEAMEAAGGEAPVADDSYNQGTQDMTAQVARMKRSDVDAIAAIGLGRDLAVLRRTMARLNMDVPLVASNGALGQPFQEGAGDLVEGVQGTMIGAFGQRPMREATQKFVDAYKAEYGTDRWWGDDEENPQLFMAISVSNGYDAANILFEGIKRAESTDPDAIIQAIESIQGYEGVNSVYNFSEDRHHAIEADGVEVFEYVKDGNKFPLVPVSEQ
ncbi:ABC transporter substrate-binding protein [Billgrantia gudaonensis]|uniref:Amino acid/amide ABC transporter substrate-binding protein, HAAT family (TC 3.A.1.4.-) n=1 Tax=Billgrantia gudaonensis TaxID=376427 RepID=A0A1G9E8H6_9GAMM|nr:ABC transporter substrate-binding protein [Halomonas gudaonensis]SDK72440.1 amino acid/amide ABC transporter substrate-binding protein, HAAT family (TC 3.A.1.4.-) [Halomonas gudaonensis]